MSGLPPPPDSAAVGQASKSKGFNVLRSDAPEKGCVVPSRALETVGDLRASAEKRFQKREPGLSILVLQKEAAGASGTVLFDLDDDDALEDVLDQGDVITALVKGGATPSDANAPKLPDLPGAPTAASFHIGAPSSPAAPSTPEFAFGSAPLAGGSPPPSGVFVFGTSPALPTPTFTFGSSPLAPPSKLVLNFPTHKPEKATEGAEEGFMPCAEEGSEEDGNLNSPLPTLADSPTEPVSSFASAPPLTAAPPSFSSAAAAKEEEEQEQGGASFGGGYLRLRFHTALTAGGLPRAVAVRKDGTMRDLKRALADAMGVARDYRPDREAPAPAQEHSGEAEADNETDEYGATDEVPVRVSLPGGRELVVLCPRRLRVPDLRRRVAAAAKLPAPPRFLVDGGALLRHGHELLKS